MQPRSCSFIHDKKTFILSLICAATTERDFSSLNTSLTFPSGSTDGAQRCALVTALSDNLVESDEEFSLSLTLVTPTASSISLGNNRTTVHLTDNECKCAIALIVAIFFFHSL